jgi:hypothetical protein
VDRDRDGEGRPFPDLGLDVDQAPVLLHRGIADPEAQAGADALRLGGKERVEDPSADRLGDAGAGVGDGERHLISRGMVPGRDRDLPAGADRLDRVHQDVQQDLVELAGVAPERRKLAQVEDELDLLPDVVADHLQDRPHHSLA